MEYLLTLWPILHIIYTTVSIKEITVLLNWNPDWQTINPYPL